MIPLLTAQEMQGFEHTAISKWGISSLVLQEHAAMGALALIAPGEPISVLAGPGNNGGDALALARLARLRGERVDVWPLTASPVWNGDAAIQARLWEGMGGRYRYAENPRQAISSFRGWVVDGFFGLGTRLPLRESAKTWVEAFQDSSIHGSDFQVLALDLPTGLDPSSPEVDGPVISATRTACFGHLKICHGLRPAKEHCGEIHVIPLPIPGVPTSSTQLMDYPRTRFERIWNTHKRSFGHIGIRAGSIGMSGAAALAALGALRSGAGLVTVLTDMDVRAEVAALVPEAMVRPWDGKIPEGIDVLLVGPGGVTDIPEWNGPMVLDASALRPGDGQRWMNRPETVITPHPGEFRRLFGYAKEECVNTSDRLACARNVSTGPGILVLKGAQSVVSGGKAPFLAVNPTGHPGLSTGGTGDFLAGMVAAHVGFWKTSQKPHVASDLQSLHQCVSEAVWLHGAAADRLGKGPMLVRDLGESLSRVLRELHD